MKYSSGMILDNSNHYGILKTETVFGFTRNGDYFGNNVINTTEPLEWIFANANLVTGALPDMESSRSQKRPTKTTLPQTRSKKEKKPTGKKHGKKSKKKFKKCIIKLLKGKKGIMHTKFLMPLMLGLLAAKSLFIPILLKALAFISAKGLMMGFLSTILALILSLKGMFEHSNGWNRKDDTNTQVEIIQLPQKSDEHFYYDQYKRDDYEHVPYRRLKYIINNKLLFSLN